MIKRTLEQIAAMAEGTLSGAVLNAAAGGDFADIPIQGVSTDSRTIAPGQLFVPLAGEHFDGHEYIDTAFAKGAAAALWQQDHPLPPGNRPLILVDDTLHALQRLAKAYRRELALRVVGITGSNGKTTTKDMTASALSTVYQVLKTKGNLNNHIGLPLTLLQLDETMEAAVLEMGMSSRGEIALLTSLAEPDVAIITNIGESHLLQLGSREEIARAKTEILAGMKDGGLLIYNGDEPLIEQVLPEMPQPAALRLLRFGMGTDNDLYPVSIQMDGQSTRFLSNDPDAPEFHIPLLGRHNVTNALAAYAAACSLGVPADKAAEGLAASSMTSMRIERLEAPNGAVVLNDAYNASPTSMRAALSLLSELTGFRRKIAVLGDMLELGEGEAAYHGEMGRKAAESGVDLLYVYGPRSRNMAEAAAERMPADKVRYFPDKPEMIQNLVSETSAGDVVLVKASRGMKLEEAVQALLCK
ncbi:UDP-N-acetylmuramoyl-tripeptide--D-alanyl-D-alanine ligase [Gorillibacterium massiliense]|uniref:UDP-N-acetylmuramoyl-tripeptide--D-alanyl-D- alanine ligase n=1 Tax=Gorillibacterium massiliense TaxID=1280390 RepID=UPI0004BCB0CE|nr:UDP-N-acetylmuramoyl-tripeptide--D-alanyl-D-alanine ligase [Gorillibacterium massiliense]